MTIEKYEVNDNNMSRDLRIKDIFDLVKYKDNNTISITKKKSIEVSLNQNSSNNRETYNLKIKNNLINTIDLNYMYILIKSIFNKEVVLDIFNRNIFNRSSIGYEYINIKDLENVFIGNYNNDLKYIINQRL